MPASKPKKTKAKQKKQKKQKKSKKSKKNESEKNNSKISDKKNQKTVQDGVGKSELKIEGNVTKNPQSEIKLVKVPSEDSEISNILKSLIDECGDCINRKNKAYLRRNEVSGSHKAIPEKPDRAYYRCYVRSKPRCHFPPCRDHERQCSKPESCCGSCCSKNCCCNKLCCDSTCSQKCGSKKPCCYNESCCKRRCCCSPSKCSCYESGSGYDECCVQNRRCKKPCCFCEGWYIPKCSCCKRRRCCSPSCDHKCKCCKPEFCCDKCCSRKYCCEKPCFVKKVVYDCDSCYCENSDSDKNECECCSCQECGNEFVICSKSCVPNCSSYYLPSYLPSRCCPDPCCRSTNSSSDQPPKPQLKAEINETKKEKKLKEIFLKLSKNENAVCDCEEDSTNIGKKYKCLKKKIRKFYYNPCNYVLYKGNFKKTAQSKRKFNDYQ